ncbi:MAG TPA: EamA family transporter [Candidatus Saccharimonadales bacterium]|nr:EamA family transporter [Candidatus Saccharimonadales bacterium]
MSWFVFALVYVFLASIGNILRKVLMRDDRTDIVGSSIIFQWVGTLICAVIAFWHGFHMPPVREYPLNYFLTASLWGFATLALYKAYKYIEASEVTILIALESVVTIITAMSLLHETFTLVNAIGTILIIFAVMYMSQVSGNFKFNKGVLYALVYSLLAGVAIVNDTFNLKHADIFSYMVVGFFLPGFFIFIINPKIITKMKPLFQPVVFAKNAVSTLFITLAANSFYLAIANGGEASQVNTIAQAAVVVTVLFSIVALKERDHLLKKFVCAILVTIGVLLLR